MNKKVARFCIVCEQTRHFDKCTIKKLTFYHSATTIHCHTKAASTICCKRNCLPAPKFPTQRALLCWQATTTRWQSQLTGAYPVLLCNLDTLHYNGRKGLFAPNSVFSHFVCTLHFCTQKNWLSADCAVHTRPKSFCTTPTPVCTLSAPVCPRLHCRHTAHGSQQKQSCHPHITA